MAAAAGVFRSTGPFEWLRDEDAEPAVTISSEHLVPTLTGLARVVAGAVGVCDVEAYLALSA